jgi:hypothetical protein
MNDIRAFVGHSFLAQDENLIRKFCDYFTQLSNSQPTFSWDHALPAEPKMLKEKVLQQLDGKNVFIAICTKKERVISAQSLRPGWWMRNTLHGSERDFEWKTSDWVIQEIGLAVGKGLGIILLIEEGVRKPGGLQGDLEYIVFERDYPERSFGKLLEMIGSLVPKPAVGMAASGAGKQEPDVQSIASGDEGYRDFITPKADWKRRNYEIAFWHTLMIGDADASNAISAAYQATESARLDDNSVGWTAFCEYSRIEFTSDGNLSSLRALAEANPTSSQVLEYLAKALRHYHDPAGAVDAFLAAARVATNVGRQLRLMSNAALEQAKSNSIPSVERTISQMKPLIGSDQANEIVMQRSFRDIADATKDDQRSLAAMERMVELNPSDIDTLFSLAFKYSSCGNEELALFHYLKIPDSERTKMTWNNLGVQFDRLSLPAKSAASYRRSEAMGETLAMANLALKFLRVGFLPEAQKILDAAVNEKDYHENVLYALTELKDKLGTEDTKVDELRNKSKPTSDFYRQSGRAMSQDDVGILSKQWDGPDCDLTVELQGMVFRAVGTYERASGGLMNALSGTNFPPDRLKVEYKGSLRGRSIEGRMTRRREDGSPASYSLLNGDDDDRQFLMIVSDDGMELSAMELSGGRKRRNYVLKCKNVSA